ncbi:hypothetical protein [Hyunsoonleella aestuarii]|nr:hypothetical protein [Hyunsoonleella aestuarii]
MSRTKILIGFIILLCVLFTVFEFGEILWLSEVSRGLIVPSITVLYITNYKPKICCFALFLILFSLAEIVSILSLLPVVESKVPYLLIYYTCNGLYATAYSFLVFNIIRTLNIRVIARNFYIHLFVLAILNSYLLYVLFKIMSPFILDIGEIFIEIAYNIAILMVLSASLINFIYKDTQKSLLMFLGSLCIVFSEVIQLAYLYISSKILLDILYTILLVAAFYFFYKQAILNEEESSVLSGNEVFK